MQPNTAAGVVQDVEASEIAEEAEARNRSNATAPEDGATTSGVAPSTHTAEMTSLPSLSIKIDSWKTASAIVGVVLGILGGFYTLVASELRDLRSELREARSEQQRQVESEVVQLQDSIRSQLGLVTARIDNIESRTDPMAAAAIQLANLRLLELLGGVPPPVSGPSETGGSSELTDADFDWLANEVVKSRGITRVEAEAIVRSGVDNLTSADGSLLISILERSRAETDPEVEAIRENVIREFYWSLPLNRGDSVPEAAN